MTDKIEVTPYSYDILRIAPNNFTELLRITPTGEVIAPSLEAASEAGRYFVQSMRGHLEVMREAIRAEVLATHTDTTPTCWLYRNSEGHSCVQFVQGLMDLNHWTETPLFSHPPATDVAALVEALHEVISATRDYLPPDGISQQECLGRVIGATDNPKIIAALAPFTKG